MQNAASVGDQVILPTTARPRLALLILSRPLPPDWPGMACAVVVANQQPSSTITRIADGQSSAAVARRSLLAFAGRDQQRCDETVPNGSGARSAANDKAVSVSGTEHAQEVGEAWPFSGCPAMSSQHPVWTHRRTRETRQVADIVYTDAVRLDGRQELRRCSCERRD